MTADKPTLPAISPSLADPTFAEIVILIDRARQRALQAVNTTLIELYWQVGGFIERCVAMDPANAARREDLDTRQRAKRERSGDGRRAVDTIGDGHREIPRRNLANAIPRKEALKGVVIEPQYGNATIDRRDRRHRTGRHHRIAHALRGLTIEWRLEPLGEDGTFKGDDSTAARERGCDDIGATRAQAALRHARLYSVHHGTATMHARTTCHARGARRLSAG